MPAFLRCLGRLLPLVVAIAAGLVIDIDTAIAQGASCNRLNAQLQQLDRNSSYRGLGGNQSQLRRLQSDLQRSESSYIRTGCNDLAKRGQTLPRDCRTLAKRITDGRAQVAALNESSQTGEAVAQQREAILQEMARFGCGGQAPQRQQRRGNILDQLFNALTGGEYSDGQIIEEDTWGYGASYNTIRTVCVRKADGYYWPISYATLPDYLYDDLQSCQAQCPTQEVDLYYYNNPGQEAEEMINMTGEAYMALPNAFRYRKEYDPAMTCKVPDAGAGVLQAAAEGQNGPVISLSGGLTIPLPRRDPRRPQVTTIAAAEPVTYVQPVLVPLPRRRPAGPGEAPPPAPPVTAQPAEAPASRIVQVAGKTVRIVGPDTPYARVGEAAP